MTRIISKKAAFGWTAVAAKHDAFGNMRALPGKAEIPTKAAICLKKERLFAALRPRTQLNGRDFSHNLKLGQHYVELGLGRLTREGKLDLRSASKRP